MLCPCRHSMSFHLCLMDTNPKETPVAFDTSRFIESFFTAGKEIILRPKVFFKHLPVTGTLKNCIVYLVSCSFLSSLFMANILQADYRLFASLLASNVVAILLGTLLFHRFLQRLFNLESPFEKTFCILAYASLMDVFAWVPVVGIAASIYGMYVLFVGFTELYNLKKGQAAASVLLVLLITGVFRLGILSVTAADWLESLQLLRPDTTPM